MTFQVRLYIHHDNDLIQLHLNGIRMCDVFEKSLEAHYKKERIQFMLPENLEFKQHKGKVHRIKITLDDRKQKDLIRWVCAFPDQYKCHCIKNIARTCLGSTVIDSLNRMSQSGAWIPDRDGPRDGVRIIRLQKWKKKMDTKDDGFQWIEQVSASRKKTESQIRRAEEGRKKIHDMPIEEILGTRPSGVMEVIQADEVHYQAAGTDAATGGQSYGIQEPIDTAGRYPETGTGGPDGEESLYNAGNVSTANASDNEDDFDASLFFEQLRTR